MSSGWFESVAVAQRRAKKPAEVGVLVDRGRVGAVERARAAGAVELIITLDWTFAAFVAATDELVSDERGILAGQEEGDR